MNTVINLLRIKVRTINTISNLLYLTTNCKRFNTENLGIHYVRKLNNGFSIDYKIRDYDSFFVVVRKNGHQVYKYHCTNLLIDKIWKNYIK